MCYMERIGVREVRQNASVYLRRVQAGEVFTVTDHGRPVAMLCPIPQDEDPLTALVAAGQLKPARGRLADLPPPTPLPPGSPTLSYVLQEMRDEDDR